MSNYTQTTFFTPKDTLPITDPNKTIFGAAFDVEFASLSTAIATKLDSTFTNPALISLNITGSASPTNGLSLTGGNLSVWAGGVLVMAASGTGVTFNVPVTLSLGSGVVSAGGFNVTASTVPTNGIYLPSTNTIGLAANTTQIATLATGGIVIGSATGGAQGAGTINAANLYVNGTAVSTSSSGYTYSTSAQSPAIINIGNGFVMVRSSAASVTSSTALASDSVLNFTIPSSAAGRYFVEAYCQFASTVTAGGARWSLNYSNVGVDNLWQGNYQQSTAGTSGFTPQTAGGVAFTLSTFNTTSGATAYFSSIVQAAGGGTSLITVQFAQGTSNGTATQLTAGSWMRVVRIT